MAGESILIVEDVPESLKFTAAVLRREGYRVSISSTAEQALSTLRFLQPDLILVDFMLPGMNGLDLTSQIKQDPRQHRTIVVALTAASDTETEMRARDAGCDGFLAKPIDARALLARVRDFLDFGKEAPRAFSSAAPPEPAAKGIAGLPDEELAELQESFLKAGKGVSRQLLTGLEAQFDVAKAARTVHQWIGSSGLLGYPAIGQRARDVENLLRGVSVHPDELRGPLTRLARTFANPSGTISETASQTLVRVLNGKRVALIGCSSDAADLMCEALEHVGARARLFDADQSAYDEAVSICHLILVHVRPENAMSRWLAREAPGLPAIPTIFFGSPEHLITYAPQAHARANGLLVDGCLLDEVLMRMRLAVAQHRPAPAGTPSPGGDIVIAYGDSASHAAIEARMKEKGLPCRLAANGTETILLLHTGQPRAAVVDVNLDGFETLAAVRAEGLPIRTLFLTSQTQDDEILRGFSLGAEDFLVQPFSPLELVARLKWLLG